MGRKFGHLEMKSPACQGPLNIPNQTPDFVRICSPEVFCAAELENFREYYFGLS